MNSFLKDTLALADDDLEQAIISTIDSRAIDRTLKKLAQSPDDRLIDEVIDNYKTIINTLEKAIWQTGKPTHNNIAVYQSVFRSMEELYHLKTLDTRYNFKVIIPVADRPEHIDQCLNSLLTLCRVYHYGGIKNDHYHKVTVLIIDDSKDEENKNQIQQLCNRFSAEGLGVEYLSQSEQYHLVKQYTEGNTDGKLDEIITSLDRYTENSFYHKGASVTRNISYLKLLQKQDNETLYFFIDSDQEFCINTVDLDENIYAINYFHYLNEAFQKNNIQVLTGKVVGDPPVSPAVMAGNFQQDILGFLYSISGQNPDGLCEYHQQADCRDDAAYHDMANLFGFSKTHQSYRYHCSLHGPHTNRDCFDDFADRLSHFFYGEHPTRSTVFEYGDGFNTLIPARTVYTGNYVIRHDALQHFIPFASLKLRMAGPVLGRLLKSIIKKRFVSANLPMLHHRTMDTTGISEFRPGVKQTERMINLGDEFIRQFYGDVMLFTIAELAEKGFPEAGLSQETISQEISRQHQAILANYADKHDVIMTLMQQIQGLVADHQHWWNNDGNAKHAINDIKDFLDNINNNFNPDSAARQVLNNREYAEKMLAKLTDAIIQLPGQLDDWQSLYEKHAVNTDATHASHEPE